MIYVLTTLSNAISVLDQEIFTLSSLVNNSVQDNPTYDNHFQVLYLNSEYYNINLLEINRDKIAVMFQNDQTDIYK